MNSHRGREGFSKVFTSVSGFFHLSLRRKKCSRIDTFGLNGYSFDIPWNIYNIRERERVKSRNGFRYDKAAVGKSLNN